jgi:hypothetical protein
MWDADMEVADGDSSADISNSVSNSMSDSPFWRRSPAKKNHPLPGTLTQTRVLPKPAPAITIATAKANVHGTGNGNAARPKSPGSSAGVLSFASSDTLPVALPAFNKEALKRVKRGLYFDFFFFFFFFSPSSLF